jgi:hypothetical protein
MFSVDELKMKGKLIEKGVGGKQALSLFQPKFVRGKSVFVKTGKGKKKKNSKVNMA